MTEHRPPVPDKSTRVDELFRSQAPAVLRMARNTLRDADRAKDIVQEVFLAVWEQYDRDFAGKSQSRSNALIMTIAKRRVIDAVRRADGAISVAEYVDSALPLFGFSVACRNPDERIVDDQSLRYVWDILTATLTEAEYQVAVLAWALWMSDCEIAKITSRSVAAVQSHKSRARSKIRRVEISGEYHIDFNPGANLNEEISEESTHNGGEVTA